MPSSLPPNRSTTAATQEYQSVPRRKSKWAFRCHHVFQYLPQQTSELLFWQYIDNPPVRRLYSLAEQVITRRLTSWRIGPLQLELWRSYCSASRTAKSFSFINIKDMFHAEDIRLISLIAARKKFLTC